MSVRHRLSAASGGGAALVLIACLTFFAAGAMRTAAADTEGQRAFERAPSRVIALNWALAEQVVELGVPIVGVADPAGYAQWVMHPPLPDGVADVGQRDAPNLERIAALAPDVILTAGEQSVFRARLETIAPVLHFEPFREDHDNAAAARRIFLDLADLLDRRSVAEDKLAAMDARLADLRDRIAVAYDGAPPEVTVVRFLDAKRVVVYGDNGMPAAALNGLGMVSRYPLAASRWGLAFKPVTELAAIDRGLVLHIEPFAAAGQLFASRLWQAMPFVAEDRFAALPPLWTYGGAMSIGRIAEAVASEVLARRAR